MICAPTKRGGAAEVSFPRHMSPEMTGLYFIPSSADDLNSLQEGFFEKLRGTASGGLSFFGFYLSIDLFKNRAIIGGRTS